MRGLAQRRDRSGGEGYLAGIKNGAHSAGGRSVAVDGGASPEGMVLVAADCSEHFADLELAEFTEAGVGTFSEVAVVAEEGFESGEDPGPDAHAVEGSDSVGPGNH